jgi:uncharacterized glyoxalase superfamily protein PhnB/predicted enzyme related to lactoylglutathione lyase
VSDDPRSPDVPFADGLHADRLLAGGATPPDPEFAASLRRRLAEVIGAATPTHQEATMTTTSAPTRAGYRRPGTTALTPYLVVHDARAAIEWYGEVFGAVVTFEPFLDDDRVGHAELTIDGTTVHLADEWPELDIVGPLARGGPSVSLTVQVPDVDATYALAMERGATSEREPVDEFYGSRAGWIRDPFGHRWGIQTYLGDDAVGSPTAGPPGPTQAQDLWDEVGYYVINVPRLAPALAFWGGLLGWEFAEARPAAEGTGDYAHVENSVVPFGIHGGSGKDVAWDPYLRVRDLRAAVARVRELGGTVESEEYGYESGGTAVCRDDQGTRFQLWQPAEGY